MADLVQRTGRNLFGSGGAGRSSSGLKKEEGEVGLPESKVNSKGEVVDQSTGDVVGKVVEGDASDLVGSLVTQSGQILGKDGSVIGKAAPLDGVLNTVGGVVGGVTKPVGDVAGGVGNAVGGLGEGLGFDTTEKGKSRGGSKDKLKDFPAASESDFGGPVGMKDNDREGADPGMTTLSPRALSQTDIGADEFSKSKPTGGIDETVEDAGGKATEAAPDLGGEADAAQKPIQDTTEQVGEKPGEVVEATGATDATKDLDKTADPGEQPEAKKSVGSKVGGIANKLSSIGGSKSKQDVVGDVTEKAQGAVPDLSALEGLKINKGGNVVDDDGNPVGRLTKGDPTQLAGKQVGKDGKIVDDSGSVVGEVEALADKAKDIDLEEPFAQFPGATVKDGKILFDDKSIGEVAEGDASQLEGKTVEAGGDIVDESGKVVGKASLKPAIAEELAEKVDKTILKGAKVNKMGNLVDDNGRVVGKVSSGTLKYLVGRRADANGDIWNDSGEKLGAAEPIPENEREREAGEARPFEAFDGATVDGKGNVVFNGEVIGKISSGDAKRVRGMKVDPDGDILDSAGNVVGHAERWEEEEPEPEPEADLSSLAGKRVNKAGNVVDAQGNIFGRVVEGDPRRMQGRMCDKKGNILSESGDVLGRAELVAEGEREGLKEGPFAELEGLTVTKDGKVVTPGGDVVGRLVSGDPKTLFGRGVDEDGDVVDRNGNVLGRAERWEEPIVEKRKGPMAGRRVNKQGEVVDEDGNIIGKLTSGDISICLGKEIDDDGDVVDSKGNTIGHVSLLADIKPEEPTESPEDKEKREKAEEDKKLAIRLAGCIDQCLDKIRPICKMITDKIDKAERTPKDELDEEELVKQVKPLIEEGSRILTESNGTIRALDPDGRIQANAKHKTATRDATPEEFRLADLLKELTGTVTKCIDDAKRKIEDMPHAKKELNPLWGLLTEPLFQILAAVGLLLTGVLGIVGRLLSGLGLGGLVDGLLGGLGLTRVLESLGLGSIPGLLTGKDKKKKK